MSTLAELETAAENRGYERAASNFASVRERLEGEVEELRAKLRAADFVNGTNERDLNATLNGSCVRVCFTGSDGSHGKQEEFVHIVLERSDGQRVELWCRGPGMQVRAV